MNPLKKLTITAAAAIPAVAMFAGVASADVVNHVVNGTFNINAKGWTVGADASVQKHDGFPIGIVTNERFSSGASTVTASQCVNLHSALDAQFEGRVLIPANQDRIGSAGFVVTMFSGDDCGGLQVGEASIPMFTTQTQQWFTHAFNLPMGNAPESARIQIAVTKGKSLVKPGADFKVFVDDIKLTQDLPEPVEEDDCLCAPAADDGTGEPEAPVEPAAEDDGPIPAEPVGSDDDDAPAEPEAPTEPAVEPVSEEPASEEPAEEADEPSQPVEEPAEDGNEEAPAAGGQQGSNDSTPAAPSTGSADGDGNDPSAEAETSDQYELEADEDTDDARELGRGQTETPGAPNTGFSVANTKDMVGADELGIFGGVLAFFGLMLAAIAIKRERSNS